MVAHLELFGICMVTTWTGKNRRAFSSPNQEILLRLEKSGNFTQNTEEKMEKSEKVTLKYFFLNIGIVGEICQPVMVKTLQIWKSSLNKKKL